MPYEPIGKQITVTVFPDPVVATKTWLARFQVFDRIYSSLPADHQSKLPFLVIRESGGPGVHDRVFTRNRLQFECWAADSSDSSRLAQLLKGLLLAWDQHDDVWNPVVIQDPTDMPDPDTGLPVHRLAAEVSFVGEDHPILSAEGA